jgi:hypothetical protein
VRVLWRTSCPLIRRESDIPVSLLIPCSHDISSGLQHEVATPEARARGGAPFPRYVALRRIQTIAVHIMIDAANFRGAHGDDAGNTNANLAEASGKHTLALRRVAVIGFS